LSLDRVFDVLSRSTRRRVLRILVEPAPRDRGEVALSSLVSEAEDVESARLELTHVHLPKLDDAGIVEWDREAGTVARGPTFEAVRPVVEALLAHEEHLSGGWS
jgi:predicted transcriptional regulator